jgi:hypothetical protein
MSNIDRPGSFRGNIIDRGISATKNGYPQLVLQLQATEHYDEQNEVWEDWSQYDETEATAYICLFGSNGKPTLGVAQAQRALGWDGASLMELQTNTTVTKAQWRMENNVYDGVTRLRVGCVDAYDAEPGRKVCKLDAADIRKLDAKYAAALKAIGGGPKPKSAKPVVPAPAPVAIVEQPVTDPTPEIAETPATVGAPVADTPAKPKRGRPAAPKVADAEVAEIPTADAAGQGGDMVVDMGAAWNKCCMSGRSMGKSDKQVAEAWVAAVSAAGGTAAVKDWSGVYDYVVAALSET